MLTSNSTLFPEMPVNVGLACSFTFEDVLMNILQENAFSTFMVERRLYMFCVCINFLNDPELLFGSLLSAAPVLHTS